MVSHSNLEFENESMRSAPSPPLLPFDHHLLSHYVGTPSMVGLEDIALGRWVRCNCTLSKCSPSSFPSAGKAKEMELGIKSWTV